MLKSKIYVCVSLAALSLVGCSNGGDDRPTDESETSPSPLSVVETPDIEASPGSSPTENTLQDPMTADVGPVVDEPEVIVSTEAGGPLESAPTGTPDQSDGPNTLSSLPEPFEGPFIQPNTSLVEMFVYEKRDDETNVLIEQIQTQRGLISEENQRVIEANLQALIFIGEGELLNEIRGCQVEIEPQDFIYVAKSTNASGDSVTLVNSDVCGSTPGLQFDDIDGVAPPNLLEAMSRLLTCININASNCE